MWHCVNFKSACILNRHVSFNGAIGFARKGLHLHEWHSEDSEHWDIAFSDLHVTEQDLVYATPAAPVTILAHAACVRSPFVSPSAERCPHPQRDVLQKELQEISK